MWVLSITLGAGGFRREANVNYNSSLSWNKAILGWFLLLTMIPGFGRTGFGRDELYPDMGMFLQKLAISTKKRLTHMIHIKNLEMIPFILHSKDPVHSQASITIKWFMHVLCVRVLYPLFILTVKKNVKVILTVTHIHIFWHYIYMKYIHIRSDIFSGIYHAFFLAFDLAIYLTFYVTFILTFYLTFYLTFLLAFYLAILNVICILSDV